MVRCSFAPFETRPSYVAVSSKRSSAIPLLIASPCSRVTITSQTGRPKNLVSWFIAQLDKGYPWIYLENLGYIDVHGCPWISMDVHGNPWTFMDINRFSLISMIFIEINGCPWIYMDICPWISWISIDICGYPLI